MPSIVRMFPILPGQEEAAQRFAEALAGPRKAEADEFYRRMGTRSESWHLQDTEHGPWVIVVTELAAPTPDESARSYAASQHPFDRWFKDQVCQICGVKADEKPLGPETTRIFAWEA